VYFVFSCFYLFVCLFVCFLVILLPYPALPSPPFPYRNNFPRNSTRVYSRDKQRNQQGAKMATASSQKSKKVPFYKLKITLNDMDNRTRGDRWRRILVPSNFTLLELHVVIQVVFGWENYHLHFFKSKSSYRHYDWKYCVKYQIKDQGDGDEYDETKEERMYKLSDIFGEHNSTVFYEYDLGKSWEHEVKLEGSVDSTKLQFPTCIDGDGANRMEDGIDYIGDQLKPEYRDKKFDTSKTEEDLRKVYEGKWPFDQNSKQCYLCAFPYCYGSCSVCNGKCCSFCLKSDVRKKPIPEEPTLSQVNFVTNFLQMFAENYKA